MLGCCLLLKMPKLLFDKLTVKPLCSESAADVIKCTLYRVGLISVNSALSRIKPIACESVEPSDDKIPDSLGF